VGISGNLLFLRLHYFFSRLIKNEKIKVSALTCKRVDRGQDPVRVGQQAVSLPVVVHVEQVAVCCRGRRPRNSNGPHESARGGHQGQGSSASLAAASSVRTERPVAQLIPPRLSRGHAPDRRLWSSNSENETTLSEDRRPRQFYKKKDSFLISSFKILTQKAR